MKPQWRSLRNETRYLKDARTWPVLLLLGVSLLAASCAGAAVDAPAGDTELQLGQDVYSRSCASCHRSNGSGGRGSKLNEGVLLESFPSAQDQLDVIESGRGTMPAFGARLSEEEIAAVNRYTREVLNP